MPINRKPFMVQNWATWWNSSCNQRFWKLSSAKH